MVVGDGMMEGEGKRIKAHTKGTQGQQHRVVSVWKAKFEALLTRVWVWLSLILFPLKATHTHTHTHTPQNIIQPLKGRKF